VPDKNLNDNIPTSAKHVTYETVNDVAERIVHQHDSYGDAWIALIDLKGYYRQLFVHESAYPYQRYNWFDLMLEDRAIMFGTASAHHQAQHTALVTCRVIESCEMPQRTEAYIQQATPQQESRMQLCNEVRNCTVPYLDDFIMITRSEKYGNFLYKRYIRGFETVRIRISESKAVPPPNWRKSWASCGTPKR